MSEFLPPLSVNAMHLWLGNQCTRNSGQVLARKSNESSYSYFSRWVAMKRFKLEWKIESFPYAQPGRRILYRPIGQSLILFYPVDNGSSAFPAVNGCELAVCYCGQGEIEAIAKEESCKSLVDAIGCVSSDFTQCPVLNHDSHTTDLFQKI